jgi:AraC-like DNA-binding protein
MDPLTDLLALLRPRAFQPKLITGAGRWSVRYGPTVDVGYGLVVTGRCQVHPAAGPRLDLAAGDFVLMPGGTGFRMTSDPEVEPAQDRLGSPTPQADAMHLGAVGSAPDLRMLGGYFRCDRANLELLRGLLPGAIHVRGGAALTRRLADTAQFIVDEAQGDRPGRELVIERLVEVLLVEALRFRPADVPALQRPGLLAGLADPALARALSKLHANVARSWTLAALASEAALSRTAFSERFARTVGVPPMEYLLAWRMALARDLLQQKEQPLQQVAMAIGYESASAFSTAFRRRMGVPPGRFRHDALRGAATSPGSAPGSLPRLR